MRRTSGIPFSRIQPAKVRRTKGFATASRPILGVVLMVFEALGGSADGPPGCGHSLGSVLGATHGRQSVCRLRRRLDCPRMSPRTTGGVG